MLFKTSHDEILIETNEIDTYNQAGNKPSNEI